MWLVTVVDGSPQVCTRNLSANLPLSQFRCAGASPRGNSSALGDRLKTSAKQAANAYRARSLGMCPLLSWFGSASSRSSINHSCSVSLRTDAMPVLDLGGRVVISDSRVAWLESVRATSLSHLPSALQLEAARRKPSTTTFRQGRHVG
jgi:hypothetical protein